MRVCFFFKQKTAYEMRISDWSSDVCSSDLDILRSVFLAEAGVGESSRIDSSRSEAVDHTDGPVVLETFGLSVSFGGIRAVDHASLKLHDNEILGIVGPNGAGKTTLFDLLSGFTAPDSGRIVLGGQDVTALGPDRRARRGLGRSFQDARLFPSMTVEETIAVSLDRSIGARSPISAALRLPGV